MNVNRTTATATFRRYSWAPVLLVACLIGACGSPDDSPEARNRQLEEYARSKGVDAEVRTGADGTRSVAINQRLGSTRAQTGTNLALPADFPGDVAIYPGMQIVSAATMPVGQMLQGHTADDRNRVASFYTDAMAAQGWTDGTPADAQSPVMQSLRFTKDKRAATINLIPAGAGTSVQIALTPAG